MTARRDPAARVARLMAARHAVIARGAELREADQEVAEDRERTLVEVFGADRAKMLQAGAANSRGLAAIEHRELVERLSREGAKVGEIADAAQLSYGHVVAIRAQLGVGRKR